MPQLRPYQTVLKSQVYDAWHGGAQNVVMRLDTGGGKTVILAEIAKENHGAVAIIAHRHEILGQLSIALARLGVRHKVIGSKTTRQAIARAHMEELGHSFYDPSSRIAVCSIDTLTKADGLASWAAQVTLWITDEGHHLVLDNKWHTGISLFPTNARGLLPTATPSRADGKGLGRHADGVADAMVQGPPMRWLIEQGYLTRYRMVIVESDLKLLENEANASGDWSTARTREAYRKSTIIGDIVRDYLKYTPGLRDITFTPDVEIAKDIHAKYVAAGVRAEMITGKTDPGVRRQILRQFEAGLVQELVVVDIVSEGFDMPAVQSGGLGRKTLSLGTYMQQFGRMLRPMFAPGYDENTQAGRLAAIAAGPKPIAWIRDHVGNFLHHGPPDRERAWTLDRRERGVKRKSDALEYRTCLGCKQPYEAFETECPFCGEPMPEPAGRSSPAMVAGDMTILDDVVLQAMLGAVADLDRDASYYAAELAAANAPPVAVQAGYNRRLEHQRVQSELRAAMAVWGGRYHAAGENDRTIQRRFYATFGYDVVSAMTLKPVEAMALMERISK